MKEAWGASQTRDNPRLTVADEFMVCIIHIMNSAELIRKLERAGWVLRGVKGAHHIYTHPQRGGHLSIPHPRKDLGAGLIHKLMKEAGVK